MKLRNTLLAALGLAFAATAAHAEIKVGVVLSATGPAASLGIPEKNTIALLPTTIGGEKVSYIVLDDASDTTTAVKNARKLTVEDKVDVIIGSTTSPASLAMVDVAAETKTPMRNPLSIIEARYSIRAQSYENLLKRRMKKRPGIRSWCGSLLNFL